MELPISRTTLENPESDRGIIATTTRRSDSGGIEAILKLETTKGISNGVTIEMSDHLARITIEMSGHPAGITSGSFSLDNLSTMKEITEQRPEILGVINPTILLSTASSSTIAQTSLLTTFDSTMMRVRWSGRVMNVGIDPIGQKRMSIRPRIPNGVVATSETSSQYLLVLIISHPAIIS